MLVAFVYPCAAQGSFLGGTTTVALAFLGGFALLVEDRKAPTRGSRESSLALRHREALLLAALAVLDVVLPGMGSGCAIVASARAIGVATASTIKLSVLTSIIWLAIGGIASLGGGVSLSADAFAVVIACAICACAAVHLVNGWLIGFAQTRGFVPPVWCRFAFGFVAAKLV